jgi:hypothetical protein
MKKINKLLLIAIIAFGALFNSCDTTVLNDLASPNALSTDKADPDLLLNSIQLAYRANQRAFQANSAQLARIEYMFGRNYFNNFGGGTLNGVWTNVYTTMITNGKAIEEIDANSEDKDLSYHIAVYKTLTAHSLMQLVDWLGDIPLSEAGNPSEFPKPKVDDDAAVYAKAIAMLTEAKVLFENTAGIGTGTDFYYDGDATKWIKLVNTLKMRSDLTLGNYPEVINATNLITTSDDDFQFNYGTNQLTPDTRHPDYSGDYTDSGAGGYQSNWLISQMVGPFGDFSASTDPRRRYYFYRQTWRSPGNYDLYRDVDGAFGPAGAVYQSSGNPNGETLSCSLETIPTHLEFTPDEDRWCSLPMGYWGRLHGNDQGTPPDEFVRTAYGVYPAGGSFDGRRDARFYEGGSLEPLTQSVGLGKGGGGAGIDPIYLSSYVDFMKAEAYLAVGGQGTMAATHFKAGITKSINKVVGFSSLDAQADLSEAPTAADISDFIADRVNEFNNAGNKTSTDGNGFPTTKDKMDLLGEQYFIAMFGGAGDAFNFIRRTGYPRTLARSIDPNPGSFPRTVLYPSGEISSNQNISQKANLNTLVFWDSGVTNPAN